MSSGRAQHVVVIGAGFTGLTAAYRLAARGHRVTVVERSHHLGGLAMTYELLGARIEKYYHHLFTSDRDILDLARELDIGLVWPSPYMGMFHGNRVYRFTTPGDLLRFSPLSLPDRIRFGAVALFLQRLPNGKRFERIPAAAWYRRFIGPQAFEVTVGPLLRAKFGRHAEKIAMVWMWGKMRTRGTSRKQGATRESLGYINGSFGTLLDRLAEEIRRRDGKIRLGHVVHHIQGGYPSPRLSGPKLPKFASCLQPTENDAVPPESWASAQGDPLIVVTSQGTVSADAVLSTVPPSLLAEWVPELPQAWRATARSLEYSAVLCTTLVLRQSLSPIYWMNISDDAAPFGGLIEHTNYIPPAQYGGRRIAYISHYTYPDEEFYSLSSGEVMRRYLPHLKRIQPRFEESWIEKKIFARDRFTQPIVGIDYAERVLPYVTPIPGLFSASMAQIFPEDRGTNYAVRAGNQVATAADQFLSAGR